MKIFDTLIETDNVIDKYINDNIKLFAVFNESSDIFSLKTGTDNFTSSFKSFVKDNPLLTGIAVSLGLNAVSAHIKNKKLTTKLFAKTPHEKKIYKNIVDQLTQSGSYKLVKTKRVDGGILYELKRKA